LTSETASGRKPAEPAWQGSTDPAKHDAERVFLPGGNGCRRQSDASRKPPHLKEENVISANNSLPQNRGRRGGGTVPAEDPSPEEIQRLCELIRQEWPEWRLRQGREDWVVPEHYAKLAETILGVR
jgi:hypothetical protein